MKTYVTDIRVGGGQVKDYFALVSKESRVASNQKPFVSLVLSDKTGQIRGKRWDCEDLVADRDSTPIEVEDIVQVVATIEEWQKKPQLVIQKIRRPKPGEFTLSDFLPASDFDPGMMMGELNALVQAYTTEKPRAFILKAIEEFGPGLAVAPASKMFHHAYIAGLLEHVLSLVRGAIALTKGCYRNLDLDVMIAGAIFHDIGKLVELSRGLGFRYTREGRLYGHIPLGFQILNEFFDLNWKHDEPDSFKEGVLHIVLSHHGSLEHGSPVVPITREALAFHMLDLLDSRMGAIAAAEKLPSDEEGFTGYIPVLRTAFLKGPACHEEQPAPEAPPQPEPASQPRQSTPSLEKSIPPSATGSEMDEAPPPRSKPPEVTAPVDISNPSEPSLFQTEQPLDYPN